MSLRRVLKGKFVSETPQAVQINQPVDTATCRFWYGRALPALMPFLVELDWLTSKRRAYQTGQLESN